MTVSVALMVAGVDVSCWTLALVRATVGRATVYEDPPAATLNATLVQDTVTGTTGGLEVGAPVELWVSTRTAPVAAWDSAAVMWADPNTTWDGYAWADPDWRLFAGRVTDARAELTQWGQWSVTVTAAGPLADLARTPIGAEPWPSETDAQRIRRVLDLAGYDSGGIPEAAGPMVLPRDVDNQPAARLILEAAEDGTGLVWEDHAAGRIAYQPNQWRDTQPAGAWDQLPDTDTWDAVAYTWDEGGSNPNTPWDVPCGAVDADPWTFTQQVGQLVTYATVTYGDPEADATAGSQAPPVYGAKITTRLVSQADAQAKADRLVQTRGRGRWDAPTIALLVDRLPAGDFASLPAQLTGGRAVSLSPMPPGSPYGTLSGFLEGWEHRFAEAADGVAWTLGLSVSDAMLTAPASLWDPLPDTVTWDSLPDTDIWDQPRLTPDPAAAL